MSDAFNLKLFLIKTIYFDWNYFIIEMYLNWNFFISISFFLNILLEHFD